MGCDTDVVSRLEDLLYKNVNYLKTDLGRFGRRTNNENLFVSGN